MFWNDPNLYGATFPYRDITPPVQGAITGLNPWQMPWQNFPRFTPQNLGFAHPYFNVQQSPFYNYTQPMQVNPFLGQMPYVQPFLGQTPYAQPFLGQTPYVPFRPFAC